jgi:hypothetical protein
MVMRNPVRRFGLLATASLVLLALMAAGAVHAAESKEILQAVKSGVPNTGSNRVVLAEITAGDW